MHAQKLLDELQKPQVEAEMCIEGKMRSKRNEIKADVAATVNKYLLQVTLASCCCFFKQINSVAKVQKVGKRMPNLNPEKLSLFTMYINENR